jgi:hypothetical protein
MSSNKETMSDLFLICIQGLFVTVGTIAVEEAWWPLWMTGNRFYRYSA